MKSLYQRVSDYGIKKTFPDERWKFPHKRSSGSEKNQYPEYTKKIMNFSDGQVTRKTKFFDNLVPSTLQIVTANSKSLKDVCAIFHSFHIEKMYM